MAHTSFIAAPALSRSKLGLYMGRLVWMLALILVISAENVLFAQPTASIARFAAGGASIWGFARAGK
jgi:hypothetical protein